MKSACSRLFRQPLFGLLSLVSIAASLPAEAHDSGLLLNGALEGDPIPLDWQVAAPKEGETFTVGEISHDAEAGQQGPNALKIEHLSAESYTQIRQFVDLPDTAKTYVLRGRAKTLGALPHTKARPAAIVGVYTPGGDCIAVKILPETSDWEELELVFEGKENARVLVMLYFDAAQGALWAEKLALQAEDAPANQAAKPKP